MVACFQLVVFLCALIDLSAFNRAIGPIVGRGKFQPAKKWLQIPEVHRIDNGLPSTTFHRKATQRMLINPWNFVKSVVSGAGEFVKELAESSEGDKVGVEGSKVMVLDVEKQPVRNATMDSECRVPSIQWRKEDELTGNVSVVYRSGDKYVGGMVDGKRHGVGTLTHKQGRVQQGEWRSGKLVNSNDLTAQPTRKQSRKEQQRKTCELNESKDLSGEKYEGEMLAEKRHGKGRYTDAEGRVAEGEWKDDQLYNGKGTLFVSGTKHVFSGTWVNGLMEGEGSDEYSLDMNGRYKFAFTGMYRHGVRHGRGTMIYPEGTRYVGEWAHGKMHGQGERFDAEGRVLLQGEWKDGKLRNGNGTVVVQATKQVFTGTWVNGLMEGTGSEVSPDGYVYVGEYKQDQRHGRGQVIYLNGTMHSGEWVQGEMH